jgi:phage gp29-like protein
VEFVANTTSQSGKGVHQTFADWCNNEMSKVILASTMTVDAQGGNYKGEVHAESEEGIFEADRRFVLRILNSQVYTLLELHGYNPGDAMFKFVDEDSIPMKDRIDIDQKGSEIVEIPPEYFYDRYNWPMPNGGAKARAQQAASIPADGGQKLSDTNEGFFKRLTDFFA